MPSIETRRTGAFSLYPSAMGSGAQPDVLKTFVSFSIRSKKAKADLAKLLKFGKLSPYETPLMVTPHEVVGIHPFGRRFHLDIERREQETIHGVKKLSVTGMKTLVDFINQHGSDFVLEKFFIVVPAAPAPRPTFASGFSLNGAVVSTEVDGVEIVVQRTWPSKADEPGKIGISFRGRSASSIESCIDQGLRTWQGLFPVMTERLKQ